MKIKRNVSFKLRAYGKNNDLFQIRLRTTFNSQRLDLKTGCQINKKSAWDEEAELVKTGYKGPKGETALSINNELRNIKDQMESTFKFFEAIDQIPTPSQLQKKYEDRLNGSVPQKPAPEPKKVRKPKEHDFFKVYEMFLKECGEKNAWTEATFEKMEAMRVDLTTFKKNIKFSDLTEATLTEFVAYMRDSKKLRTPRKKKGEREDYDQEDLVGLKNSTIEKKLGYLRWFLNWATDRGYNTNLDYKKFHPTLKMTQRKVIYLTKEEIARVRDLELSEAQAYLDPIRDIFLFCCFSGLPALRRQQPSPQRHQGRPHRGHDRQDSGQHLHRTEQGYQGYSGEIQGHPLQGQQSPSELHQPSDEPRHQGAVQAGRHQ